MHLNNFLQKVQQANSKQPQDLTTSRQMYVSKTSRCTTKSKDLEEQTDAQNVSQKTDIYEVMHKLMKDHSDLLQIHQKVVNDYEERLENERKYAVTLYAQNSAKFIKMELQLNEQEAIIRNQNKTQNQLKKRFKDRCLKDMASFMKIEMKLIDTQNMVDKMKKQISRDADDNVQHLQKVAQLEKDLQKRFTDDECVYNQNVAEMKNESDLDQIRSLHLKSLWDNLILKTEIKNLKGQLERKNQKTPVKTLFIHSQRPSTETNETFKQNSRHFAPSMRLKRRSQLPEQKSFDKIKDLRQQSLTKIGSGVLVATRQISLQHSQFEQVSRNLGNSNLNKLTF